ncbi:hypothetical protein RHMOL_Rhmol02G0241000 [Rhododendron molle]|uniref:Uncharacterized protein n=1 Tax=Rhododendron molle TaxID=49168 RepID=A0ACC0PTD3_RHOML|nr:hypothetical protein RHMOL_Rhmol02G0241000 [Rhododendron molle]
MADHGSNSDGGEVVDRPGDAGGPMETQTGDQTATEEAVGTSVAVAGGGHGGEGREQEVGGGENRRATEAEPRATEGVGTVVSSVESVGPGTAAEGMPEVGGSSANVGGSGAVGDDPGPERVSAEGFGERQGRCSGGRGDHRGSC